MNSRNAILMAAFVGYLAMVCLPLMLGFYTSEGHSLARRPFWDDLSSSLAMIGFAVILIEFLLLGRFRPLSILIGSDFLMQAHQLLARTALAFLVIHPFLYSLWGSVHQVNDPSYVAALKIDGASLLTGGIAWVLLHSLVFTATKRQTGEYDRWRFWHASMALLLLVTGLHHTLSAGRYSAFTPLHRYWWLLAVLAFTALAIVYVIRPILQKQRGFEVTAVKRVALGIDELVIKPVGRFRLHYQAGQFAWIKLGSTSATHDHPFSIASVPESTGEVRFLIKSIGDFTASIAKTTKGTRAYLDGPHGHFRIPDNAQAVIMIAGGIGIAPFCALLASSAIAGDRRPIRLIYANRLEAQQLDVSTIAKTSTLSDFNMIPVIGEPDLNNRAIVGQLDVKVLAQLLTQPEIIGIRDTATFMICGPAEMIDSVEATLVHLGIPLSRIISEKFQYDFNTKSPRSKRTLGVWIFASTLLLAAALATAFR